jgi:hypothetical protein
LINDSDLQRDIIEDVSELTSAIRHWGNIEYLYMRRDAKDVHNRYIPVQESLVELYEKILDVQVDLSIMCQQNGLG